MLWSYIYKIAYDLSICKHLLYPNILVVYCSNNHHTWKYNNINDETFKQYNWGGTMLLCGCGWVGEM